MDPASNSDESSALFLWTTVAVHSLLWWGSLALIAWYVMKSMEPLNDFGVDLSQGAIWVIALTDWIVSFWFVVFPLAALFAAGADALIFSLTRSTLLRGLGAAMGCILPLLLTGVMFRTISEAFGQLQRELN